MRSPLVGEVFRAKTVLRKYCNKLAIERYKNVWNILIVKLAKWTDSYVRYDRLSEIYM